MAFRLAKDILHFLRDHAAPTSLRRLQREGVENVTVIDMDQIEDLIHRCVDRVLRGANLDPTKIRHLGEDAREEFLRLISERDSLKATTDSLSKEREELRQNLTLLQQAITQTRDHLDTERAEEQAAKEHRELSELQFHEELRAAIAAALAGVAEDRRQAVVDQVAALAENRIRTEVDKVRDLEAAARRERIGTLERRIEKLRTALADAEGMVDRLRAEKSAQVDDGVASVYREVQGLSDKEPEFARKKGLLEEIFKLNLELKELVGNGTQSHSS